jgi:sodium pump decarboxylase gamma subunit
MFGEHISMSQALFVTLLSMGVVFVVLVTIAFLLGYFEKLFSDPKPKAVPVATVAQIPLTEQDQPQDDPALIAVITAAILANQTASYPIRIRKIRRVGETQIMWQNQGNI